MHTAQLEDDQVNNLVLSSRSKANTLIAVNFHHVSGGFRGRKLKLMPSRREEQVCFHKDIDDYDQTGESFCMRLPGYTLRTVSAGPSGRLSHSWSL